MDLDRAHVLTNDSALIAYCDYAHRQIFRIYGQYELGFDDTYDEVAYAFAYVAVEGAFSAESLQWAPEDPPNRESAEQGK